MANHESSTYRDPNKLVRALSLGGVVLTAALASIFYSKTAESLTAQSVPECTIAGPEFAYPSSYYDEDIAAALHVNTHELRVDGRFGTAFCKHGVSGKSVEFVRVKIDGFSDNCIIESYYIDKNTVVTGPSENKNVKFRFVNTVCIVKPTINTTTEETF